MKIEHIKKEHILQAATFIDDQAVPGQYLKNQYWVVINNKEYPFKYLLRIADKYANPQSKGLDFQSTKGFRDYLKGETGFNMKYYPGWSNFFTQDELEIFNTVVKKKYHKQSKDDILLGRRILPLFHKTKYWANQLQIEGFEVREDSLWQISGQFKPYTWARIYRRGQEAKKMFFTVGVSAERKQLVYKIDCQWSQTNKAHALLPS